MTLNSFQGGCQRGRGITGAFRGIRAVVFPAAPDDGVVAIRLLPDAYGTIAPSDPSVAVSPNSIKI